MAISQVYIIYFMPAHIIIEKLVEIAVKSNPVHCLQLPFIKSQMSSNKTIQTHIRLFVSNYIMLINTLLFMLGNALNLPDSITCTRKCSYVKFS